MKIAGWFALAAVALIGTAEIAGRAAGALDFPLYEPGPPYGYIPRPNQHGAFLNRYDYAFNEISMGVARSFQPNPEKTDTLLIGDSIVLGGNPYRQAEKLGPLLERVGGETVWPVGAGSWSLSNELTYLDQHPEVERDIDRVVFVLNSGDFTGPSIWAHEETHPTKHPISSVWYLLQKKFAASSPGVSVGGDPIGQWHRFRARYRRPVMVVLYPDRSEAASPSKRREFVQKAEALLGPGVVYQDVGAEPGWGVQLYKDSIHPKPTAMQTLARLISAAEVRNLPP